MQHLRAQLCAHSRLQGDAFEHADGLSVCVPIKLRVGDEVISLISMIAQFGGIQEITYSGLHVELFFPEVDLTQEHFQRILS